MPPLPNRGEIWQANLNPTRGHEQAGLRPVLVISTNSFNHGPSGLVVVLPLTRTNRHIPLHIPILPPEGGLTSPSYVLCDAMRSISRDRLGNAAWGHVSPSTFNRIEEALRTLLEL